MVLICREIKRVLKKSGSLYINLGDTYCSTAPGTKNTSPSRENRPYGQHGLNYRPDIKYDGKWLQPKQLLGMPWRVTIALQNDGWILRNDIIWHKSNPLPSSVKDRLSNTFEHVFHLVKAKKYYYDLDAIREPHKFASLERYQYSMEASTPGKAYPNEKRDKPFSFPMANQGKQPKDVLKYDSKYKDRDYGQTGSGMATSGQKEKKRIKSRMDAKKLFPNNKKKQQEYINYVHDHDGHVSGKNPGDVWIINTQPFTGYNDELEHFAVFPESLVLKPLKSSCPKEICKKCGQPRVMIREVIGDHVGASYRPREKYKQGRPQRGKYCNTYDFKGYSDCGCNAGFESGVVLDPFGGRGTVGKVAKQLGLHYILFDIKPEYCELARLYIAGQKNKIHKDQDKLKL
jgi:DNA modification methylase